MAKKKQSYAEKIKATVQSTKKQSYAERAKAAVQSVEKATAVPVAQKSKDDQQRRRDRAAANTKGAIAARAAAKKPSYAEQAKTAVQSVEKATTAAKTAAQKSKDDQQRRRDRAAANAKGAIAARAAAKKPSYAKQAKTAVQSVGKVTTAAKTAVQKSRADQQQRRDRAAANAKGAIAARAAAKKPSYAEQAKTAVQSIEKTVAAMPTAQKSRDDQQRRRDRAAANAKGAIAARAAAKKPSYAEQAKTAVQSIEKTVAAMPTAQKSKDDQQRRRDRAAVNAKGAIAARAAAKKPSYAEQAETTVQSVEKTTAAMASAKDKPKKISPKEAAKIKEEMKQRSEDYALLQNWAAGLKNSGKLDEATAAQIEEEKTALMRQNEEAGALLGLVRGKDGFWRDPKGKPETEKTGLPKAADAIINPTKTMMQQRAGQNGALAFMPEVVPGAPNVWELQHGRREKEKESRKEKAAQLVHDLEMPDYRLRQGYEAMIIKGLGSVPSLLETARATITGEEVDPQWIGQDLMRESELDRQNMTRGMSGGAKFAADTAYSIAENAATLPLALVNPALPLAAMGTGAAAEKTHSLNRRGISAGQALTRGLISGGIEAATEKIPLGSLMKMLRTGGKGVIKNILKQAGIEATEESVAYILNTIADYAAKDPEAKFSLQELALSAAGGAVSGGVFSVGGMAGNRIGSLFADTSAPRPQPLPVPQTQGRQANANSQTTAGVKHVSNLRLHENVKMDGYNGLVTKLANDGMVTIRFYDPKTEKTFDRTITPQKAAALKGIKLTERQITEWKSAVLLPTPQNVSTQDSGAFERAGQGAERLPTPQNMNAQDNQPPKIPTLNDHIRNNRQLLAEHGVIAEIKGNALSGNGDTKLIDRVHNFFKSIGEKVTRPGFGDVKLTRSGARDSISHGIGPEKAAAFAAVPDVIQKGQIIDQQHDWKDRRFDTVVFGGRITIDGLPYDMGVIVKKYDNSRELPKYYLHEVLLVNEEGEATTFKTGTRPNDSVGNPSEVASPSNASITQEDLDVNSLDAEKGKAQTAETPGFRQTRQDGAVLSPIFDAQGRQVNPQTTTQMPQTANPQTLGRMQDVQQNPEIEDLLRETIAERVVARNKAELAQQRQTARDAEFTQEWERVNNHQIRRNAHYTSGLKLHDRVIFDGYSGIVTEFTGDGKISVQFYDVRNDNTFIRVFTPEEAAKTLQVKQAGQAPETPKSRPAVREITEEEYRQKWMEDRVKDLRSEFTENDEKAATLVLRGDDNAVTMADNPRLVREYCDIFPDVVQTQIDTVQAQQAQTAAENATQMQQGKERMAQMTQLAPQQQAAPEPTPSAPAVGEKVRSAKMGNMGTIVNINEDGTYRIKFENKQTNTFLMRDMKADEFETIRQPPAPDAASREMAQNQMDALESDSYKQPEQDAIDAADHTLIREDSPNAEMLRAWSDYRKAKARTEQFLKSNQAQEMTQHDKDIAQSILLNGNEEDAHLANHPALALEYARLQAAEREMYKPISKHNAERMEALMIQANKDAETIAAYAKDKRGIQYQTETMERNLYDIFGKEHRAEAQDLIDRYITPVHKGSARGNRIRVEMRQRVKNLELTKHESEIVYYLLENEKAAALAYAEEHKIKIDDARQQKLDKAAQTFRDIYNTLFAMINDVQIENGIEPTEFRRDYAPHSAEEMPDTRLARAFYLLGMKITNENNLPTDLAGITETFRPGHQWFGHLERRQGGKTIHDAVKTFDAYIDTAVDVITLTESIQKIRALEDAVRYRLSDDGTRQLVDNIRENRDLDALQRRQEIEKVYENRKTGMPGLVAELRDYGNRLAGKKHRRDRGIEDDIGRDIYSISHQVQSRVAANMIALNPGSWLTNFIPLTQATGELGNINMLRGMLETVKNYGKGDGFVDCSDFLVNRRGSDSIAKSTLRKMSDAAGAPMQWIDMFTAESIVRARTMQNQKNGMDFDTAVNEADAFAASVMADRSKGAMPSIFERQSPLVKPFTMFQLEVNNQLRYLGKDLPRRLGEKGVMAIAAALTRIFAGAWLYNQAYSWLTGRDAALDPVSIVQDALEGIGDPDDKRTAKDRAWGLGKNVLEELPFVGGLAGGGRLPISAALPTSFTSKELMKPATYLLLPFGGGAIKKTAEGIATVRAGGAYDTDKDGRQQLLFPQYGQDFSDYALAALFGKYRTKEAQDYVKSGFQRLNADETAAYQYMTQNGMDAKQSYEAVKKLGFEDAKTYKKLVEHGIEHQTALDALQKMKEAKPEWKRKMPGEPGSGWDDMPETKNETDYDALDAAKNRVIMDLDISAADKALMKWIVGVEKPIDFSSEDAFAITSALSEKDQKDALSLYHDDGFTAEQAIKYGGLVPDAVSDGEDSYSIKINAWDTIRGAKDLTDAQKNAAMEKVILPSLGAKWRGAAADKFIGDISATEKAYFAITMQQIDKSVDNDISIHEADKKEYKKLRKTEFIQELGLADGEQQGMTFGQREMLTWFMSADNGDLKETWDDCMSSGSDKLRENAPALRESGLDVDLYKVISAGLNRLSGDKGKKYSRRNKRIAYLDQWEGLTTSQKVLIMKSIDDKYEYGSSKKSGKGKGKGKGGRKSGGGSKGSSAASGMMSGFQTL